MNNLSAYYIVIVDLYEMVEKRSNTIMTYFYLNMNIRISVLMVVFKYGIHFQGF